MPIPSTYIVVPTAIFKLLVLQTTNQYYFILKVLESGSWWLIKLSNTWNHLTVCKQLIKI